MRMCYIMFVHAVMCALYRLYNVYTFVMAFRLILWIVCYITNLVCFCMVSFLCVSSILREVCDVTYC